MKNIAVFNFLVMMILFLLFSWQTYYAVVKYLTYDTRMSSSNIDAGSILYPSITVCKKYSDGLSQQDIKNKSYTIKNKIDILHRNFWRKDKLFYFFSHSKMFNTTFPCNTLDGATEQGKACSFPFIRSNGIKYTECSPISEGSASKFCFTRYINYFIQLKLILL